MEVKRPFFFKPYHRISLQARATLIRVLQLLLLWRLRLTVLSSVSAEVRASTRAVMVKRARSCVLSHDSPTQLTCSTHKNSRQCPCRRAEPQ